MTCDIQTTAGCTSSSKPCLHLIKQAILRIAKTRTPNAATHLAQQHVLEHGHGARVVQRAQLLKGLKEVGVGGLVVLFLCRGGKE